MNGSVLEKGALYVVATPIGNLGDISARALEVLAGVDVIAAEDTRHSGQLLAHFGIKRPMAALHEHNERSVVPRLIERLRAGDAVALVSDAGTPLVNDPGFHLVKQARAAGIRVVPVPGPSAVLGALSASGLPSARFAFEGFLPAAREQRRRYLETLRDEPRTLIFFEAPHRIPEAIEDMREVLGPERQAVVARELTKQFEEIRDGTLQELGAWLNENPERQRGEFVVLVAGAPARETDDATEAERILSILLSELPMKQAVNLAARITCAKKNVLYKRALRLKQGES
jgi:16S rRNA (cytidine1402-2'-O)-methyltransferase